MQTHPNRKRGFTLLEIMIVVAIIGLLAGISTPSALRARENSQMNSILSNLRAIENSKDQWAIDNKTGVGAQPLDTDITQYLRSYKMPIPVVGETYIINPIGSNAVAQVPVKILNVAPGGFVILP